MNGRWSDMIEGNLLIRASAGTGKTFALATRFIRLMLLDRVEPERIVALTFSRAAAQEIYTKLLERLWQAATNQQGADEERQNLMGNLSADTRAKIDTLPIAWTPETFAELLRKVVAVQHLGAIATLDSFILRLVGNFPLEMGFQNAVEVLDPSGETEEVDRAAKSILNSADDNDRFVEAFRAAEQGCFSRMCARTLGDMMDREGWRKFLLGHPECKTWTAESMAVAMGLEDFAGFADISAMQTAKVCGDVTDKTAAKWLEKFMDHLVSVKQGENPIPSGGSIPIEFAKAVVRHPDKPYVDHQKKQRDGTKENERREFPQSVFAAAHADLGRLADAFLRRQLKVVEAKIKLLAIIDREYDTATRRMGKLTFQDITNVAKDNAKIELDNLRFRFDAKLDHWALDEFQDTSEVQWACLNSLVESAASGGSSASRSVIAVGDLKQSIYTWRGGDDKPFEEMMSWPWFGTDEDGTVYGRIENSKTSYRYGKHIADFINRVFGPDNLRKGGLIPAARSAAVERWLRDDCWLEHVPQYDKDGKPKVQDYVKVVGACPDDDPESEHGILPALYREIADVWKARTHAGSVETIGILVRDNKEGILVAEYLRRKGIPVVWEGMNAVSDVPVVQAVLNLLKLAEHPEDTFAWTTVNTLLPIRKILFPTLNSAADVSSKVAELFSHQGLARMLKDFCGTLSREENGLDGLSRSRLRSLVRLGVGYEQRRTADYGVDGFERFVAAEGKRESAASSNAIRILTIHRSKGLTLDRVYVLLFEGNKDSIVEPKDFSALFGKGRQWVLPHISADVAALNDETHAVLEEQRDARLLEQLRTYYVALTRSRKALTVIFSLEDYRVLLFRDLISHAVDSFEVRPCDGGKILFEDGEYPAFVGRNDDQSSSGKRSVNTPDIHAWMHLDASAGRDGSMSQPRIQRRSPSRLAHVGLVGSTSRSIAMADTLFGEGYGASARHGVDVHNIYSQIEWIDSAAPADGAVIMPEGFRSAFVKPTSDATVWRERSYELMVGNCWDTGRFDRVVFTGATGNRSATIYDFKTNACDPGESVEAFANRMRGICYSQMSAYRWALHRLTRIPLDRINTRLLLEATGQSVAV